MILGLDIGSNSIGWCLLATENGEPRGIVAAGVRCFDAGVAGALDQGREESRNAKRRMARQARRQTWRRQRRQQKLFRLLQRYGLLPATASIDPQAIHDCLLALDARIRSRDAAASSHVGNQTVLYRLRARAAQEPLGLEEVGRALYHLAQRRGFLSNRKQRPKDDKEQGDVREGIATLESEIAASGLPTLGAYFATLDPTVQRIRGRWTSRQMYQHEFEQIWLQQSKHHGALDDTARREIWDAIFHQRPLKSQADRIGRCDLEPEERRAPLALPIAQRFRLLQTVNHLRIAAPTQLERVLSATEREVLIAALETKGDLTCAKARQLLKLPKGTVFTIEEGGENRLPGNRTEARLRRIFGARWDTLSVEDREQVVEDLRSIETAEALERRGRRHWKLAGDALLLFKESTLEDGHASHSVKAIRRLLPHLEAGAPYSDARKQEYPQSFRAGEALDLLPPLRPDRRLVELGHAAKASVSGLPDLRNPAVERALSELRKLVNGIVRRYGKPELVRIELARDLKRSKKERARRSKEMREQEGARKAAARKILEDLGNAHPTRSEVEKVLLANECGWRCPYTGRPISMTALLGTNPQFDVEHIIPFSRSLEDGFWNKTLCFHDENRNVKRNRTPFEAYGESPRFEEILQRVRDFQGAAAREKLQRFERSDIAEEIASEFLERQLNDTRYASRLAADYVGRLYGGVVDAPGRRRVQVSAGGVTAFLRGRWQLNGILGDGGGKNREDHRHHAVDAAVIACTGPAEVKRLALAAKAARDKGSSRLFAEMEPPWPTFLEDVRRVVDGIVASHRAEHRLNGALHDETLYGPARSSRDGKGRATIVRHVRRPIADLSGNEVEAIVDPLVRAAVQNSLRAIGGVDPKKAFALAESHPYIRSRDGGLTPIHRVRIRKVVAAVAVGRGPSQRHVAPGSNHHMAIVGLISPNGAIERWEGHVVSRLEAIERKRRGEAVVRRDWGEGRRFMFSLTSGDSVRVHLHGGAPELCRAVSVSARQIELIRSNDARPQTEIRRAGKTGGRITVSVDGLRRMLAEKVFVSPLGDVTSCHD